MAEEINLADIADVQQEERVEGIVQPESKFANAPITDRLDVFLAMIAGREDADLSSFTPPVPTNMTEQLLMEIAERLDNLSKFGEAEQVGVLEESPSIYS